MTDSSFNVDDLDKLFEKRIDSFFYRRDQVFNILWACQLEHSIDSDSMHFISQSEEFMYWFFSDVTLDMRRIRDWFSSQDRILWLISSDITNIRGKRDEFTCEWFQIHLMTFTRSFEDVFLVIESGGSNKNFFSSWIAERLQRTLKRKIYAVISISIDM